MRFDKIFTADVHDTIHQLKHLQMAIVLWRVWQFFFYQKLSWKRSFCGPVMKWRLVQLLQLTHVTLSSVARLGIKTDRCMDGWMDG